jgi:hypothetical protein
MALDSSPCTRLIPFPTTIFAAEVDGLRHSTVEP